VRDLVFDVFPQSVEVVWPRQGSVGWGHRSEEVQLQFCCFTLFKGHVTSGASLGSDGRRLART
jgi:hypothetical protein